MVESTTTDDAHAQRVEEIRNSRLDIIVHSENGRVIIKEGNDIIETDRSGASRLAKEIVEKLDSEEPLFSFASVVRITMDDPVNENVTEGTVQIVAGRCEDGIAHTVRSDEVEGFVDVTCEVLERFETETPMTKSDIKDWAMTKAQLSEVQYE